MSRGPRGDWKEDAHILRQRALERSYGFIARDTRLGREVEPQPQIAFNFIDGRSVPSADGRTLDDIEPATGRLLARIPRSGPPDVAAAVDAARAALPAWSATALDQRCAVLDRIAGVLERNAEAVAQLESRDAGKTITQTRTVDVPRAVRNFRFFAQFAREFERREVGGPHVPWPADPSQPAGHSNYTHRRPVGVVGLVTPWNLPIYLLTWKVAPALAMGNTVVAKPSELTPLSAEALCRVAEEAGLPAGVLNVVHGLGAEAGQAVVEHPDVKAVSFTGGTATGVQVAKSAAPHFKKLSLELGGKNASVVFADCDLDETVAGVVRAGFTNTGQVCLCGSRILVEESIERKFTQRLVEAVKALKMGDPADEATQLGALISADHRAKVERYIAFAKQDGGRVLCGGVRPEAQGTGAARGGLPDRVRGGFFLEPTVITGLGQSSRCVQEEIFGPVVTVQSFGDEAEAVQLANDVRYGLAATVWTRDDAKARRVAEALDAGMVWVNCWLVRDLRVPFGGMKASGVGREGGQWSLEFFSEARNITIKDRTTSGGNVPTGVSSPGGHSADQPSIKRGGPARKASKRSRAEKGLP